MSGKNAQQASGGVRGAKGPRGGRDGIPTHWTLETHGRECPRCRGAGCSYCGGEGRIWKTRADPIAPVYGTRMRRGDLLVAIPEEYHVIVSPEVTPAALAAYLEPLTDFAEHIAQKLFEAPFANLEADTGTEHGYYERLLVKLRAQAEAIAQGDVKPYPGYALTSEQKAEKARQAARSLTRSLTHLAFVVDKNRDREVLAHSDKRGWYVARWVKQDVPSLLQGAFAAAETMASLAVHVDRERETLRNLFSEVLGDD